MNWQQVGSWAFILGVILAVLVGLVAFAPGVNIATIGPWITLVLVVLGIIIGFLNIEDKETVPFLVAAIALLSTGAAVNSFSLLDMVVEPLGSVIVLIINNIIAIIAPATIIVALMSFKKLASAGKAV